MAKISALSVSKATDLRQGNWIVTTDVFGPQVIRGNPLVRGHCVVTAVTSPNNNVAEWDLISWSGGKVVPGRPNQRAVSRLETGMQTITATIDGVSVAVKIWVVWANMEVRASGARPSRAIPWSQAILPYGLGPDLCGAFKVRAPYMTENARGQIVATATLSPAGVGAVISNSGNKTILALHRERISTDFVDGGRASTHTLGSWKSDDSKPEMLNVDPSPDDQIFDTDAPDMPFAMKTAETYNNFRQWVTLAGEPCSTYGLWFFRAQWKNQKVIMLEVGSGAKLLPAQPQVK